MRVLEMDREEEVGKEGMYVEDWTGLRKGVWR